jgi:hypothetical protein
MAPGEDFKEMEDSVMGKKVVENFNAYCQVLID